MKKILLSFKTNCLLKKVFFFAAIIFALMATVQTTYSQTNGVLISPSTGTANASAMLEVSSDSKGLLIPQVALTSISELVRDVYTYRIPMNDIDGQNTSILKG